MILKLKDRLKQKWDITTERDFWLIMLTFSLAGMTVMPLRTIVFGLLGFNDNTPLWQKICVYLPLIPPAYQIGLLFFGTLLGQFNFFWNYQKRLLNFLLGRKNIKHQVN